MTILLAVAALFLILISAYFAAEDSNPFLLIWNSALAGVLIWIVSLGVL